MNVLKWTLAVIACIAVPAVMVASVYYESAQPSGDSIQAPNLQHATLYRISITISDVAPDKEISGKEDMPGRKNRASAVSFVRGSANSFGCCCGIECPRCGIKLNKKLYATISGSACLTLGQTVPITYSSSEGGWVGDVNFVNGSGDEQVRLTCLSSGFELAFLNSDDICLNLAAPLVPESETCDPLNLEFAFSWVGGSNPDTDCCGDGSAGSIGITVTE